MHPVKQYHKEGQALRTETTINDTYDFEIGRALRNLPAPREIGFAANQRLLRAEYLRVDRLIGDDRLDAVAQPIVVDDQRAAALRFGDRRVLALKQSLCLFALTPTGFRHRDVRTLIAQLLGRAPDEYAGSKTPTTSVACGYMASSSACRATPGGGAPNRRITPRAPRAYSGHRDRAFRAS